MQKIISIGQRTVKHKTTAKVNQILGSRAVVEIDDSGFSPSEPRHRLSVAKPS